MAVEHRIPIFIHTCLCVLSTLAFVTAQQNSTSYVLLGCFYDSPTYDVLPDLISCNDVIHEPCHHLSCNPEQPYCQSDAMTVELCFQICANQSARYFGLQDGNQCLCGGDFAPFNQSGAPTQPKSCYEKNCTGNSSQSCGGSFTNLVYEIKESSSDCYHPGFLNVGEESYPLIGQSDFDVNDILNYDAICQSPSYLNESPEITCTAHGWSKEPPVCHIRCSLPEAMPFVSFGHSQTNIFEVGECVMYSCNLNDTRYEAECSSRGLWVLPTECPPTCSSADLPLGGGIARTSDDEQFSSVGTLLNFVCDGATSTYAVLCQESGQWNISSDVCPEPTTVIPPPTVINEDNERSSVPPDLDPTTMTGQSGSTTGVGGEPSGGDRGWVVAVAVVIPLIILVVIVVILFCYWKRKEDEENVPQVVLGYIKKTGTLGGTLKRNRDPEQEGADAPEGEPESNRKSGTLTQSLNTMKREFVKRVTLNRNRPDLPPKKNPKNSRSRSVPSTSEAVYVSPKSVRAGSNATQGGTDIDGVAHPPPPGQYPKKMSVISIMSSFKTEFDDDVFAEGKDVAFDGTKNGLRGRSGSHDLLNDLMVEFDGRVNHGYDENESSARSSPSLTPQSRDSPMMQRVDVHPERPAMDSPDLLPVNGHAKSASIDSNENLTPSMQSKDSPYDSLGPKRAKPTDEPAEISSVNDANREPMSPLSLNTSPVINGDASYYVNSKRKPSSGPESPAYATLGDLRAINFEGDGTNGPPPVTSPKPPLSPPLNHDYVNVGRKMSSPHITAEFQHPRRPSLPADTLLESD